VGSLSLDDWDLVLNQYQELLDHFRARSNIVICGGEPLASPHLFHLLDKVVSRWNNSFVGVLTNGTLVQNKIEKLKKYPLYFQVSLESPFESHHDQIRGRGTFQRAIDGIRLLKESHFEVHLLVILSRRSSTEIESMFQFAKNLGVNSLNYTRAIPEGAGRTHFESSDEVLIGPDLKDAFYRILTASRKYGVPTNSQKPLFSLVSNKPASSINPRESFQGIVVGYRREIKPSSRSSLVLGNVKNEALKAVYFYHETYRNLRKGRISKCSSCRYFQSCGGDRNIAYATTGDFLGPDNGCWLNT
jgi:radical SAM protein with 4Fe4S-binding SPASM domain